MKEINRREFLGSMGTGAAGTFANKLMSNRSILKNDNKIEGAKNINPRSIKLNVQLVFGALIHSGMWEGPCRWDVQSTPDEERNWLRNRFKRVVEESK